MDLPFTLDQPTPAPAPTTPDDTAPRPSTTAGPAETPGPNGTLGPDAAPGPEGAVGSEAAVGTDPPVTPSDPVNAAGPDGRVGPATGGGTNGAADQAGRLDATGTDGADRPLGSEATATPTAAGVIQANAQADAGRTLGTAAASPERTPGAAVISPDGPAGTPPNDRPESPWAQPPQRSTGDAPAPPAHPGPVVPPTQSGAAQPDGRPADPAPVTPAAGAARGVPDSAAEGSPDTPPRLGPFPPSPGVPLQQPYGDGTGYPPGPVGYGQPAPQPGAPGWYPPAWPQEAGTPPQAGAPQQPPAPPHQPGPHQPAPHPPGPHQAGPHQAGPQQTGPQQPGPAAFPEQVWTPASGAPPTAEDFARRRQARPVDPVATTGVRAVVNKIGLVRLPPGRQEQEMRRDIEMVRRNFGGLRQVTVVNPKGGAGKTVAILLLAMTFGQKRGGYVLAWDNNETQGTLGMRAQQDFHSRTVRDMLRDLAQFQGPHGRVGDLSQYVRSQGEGMFDVLASDESATGGEMLTAAAFAEIREVVSRFYKLIFVDTGNNVRAQNWQAAMDATDQLVVTMSARNDSAETAARMLDHLEQSGRQRLVRQAVTVVSMPPSRKEIDLPAIQEHFAARTRAVLLAPYERLIDTGEPIRYGQLSSATREAWLKIAASVAEGL
ncbi:chromosome partitioning protein [Micromonospora chaiyaphumensis]|uniref:chromosome partitioning protein n=1 Tax=Micromonospora chaiyaphumensis TaxID=307119 RepID=UPI0035E82A20